MFLEEKVDKLSEMVKELTGIVEKLVNAVELTPAPKAKGKGKAAKPEPAPEVVTEEVETEATDVTSKPEVTTTLDPTIGEINELIKTLATTVEGGREKVLKVFKTFKVTTSASLKPEQYAECYGLLEAEK